MRNPRASALRLTRSALHWTGIGRLRPVRRLYNALLARAKDPRAVVTVHGCRMHLDPTDDLSLSAVGIFERHITALIQREVRPGGRVLDIGAHIGYYTVLCAQLVGPTGHVWAFEPSPRNY